MLAYLNLYIKIYPFGKSSAQQYIKAIEMSKIVSIDSTIPRECYS